MAFEQSIGGSPYFLARQPIAAVAIWVTVARLQDRKKDGDWTRASPRGLIAPIRARRLTAQ
jgi:hypothetical protein